MLSADCSALCRRRRRRRRRRRAAGLPCHLAAALNQPDCLHMLLSAGVGAVDDPTAQGFTPLMLAATGDGAAAAAVLLRAGAALEARNDASRTALFLAAVSGSPATLDLLIRAGADVGCCLPACLPGQLAGYELLSCGLAGFA